MDTLIDFEEDCPNCKISKIKDYICEEENDIIFKNQSMTWVCPLCGNKIIEKLEVIDIMDF